MATETVPLESGVLWAPVIYIKAPSVGGIETGLAERLAPEATEAEAMAAAVRALQSRPDAVSASAVAIEPELDTRGADVVAGPTAPPPPRLTGRRLMSGSRLQCPPLIEAVDEVDVDFDIDLFTEDGLYALELIRGGRVAWMGCRAFRRRVDGVVEVDDDGRGSWRSIAEGGGMRDLRIAGRVLDVYRGGRLPCTGTAEVGGYVDVPSSIPIGPEAYALMVDGECMAPLGFRDGETVVCDPGLASRLGDVVAVWWHDTTRKPAMKRLASGLPPSALWAGGDSFFAPGIVFEQLNPPRSYRVSLADVRAVHRIVGKVPSAAAAH